MPEGQGEAFKAAGREVRRGAQAMGFQVKPTQWVPRLPGETQTEVPVQLGST